MKQLEGYLKGINLGGWISQCGEKYNEEHYNSFIKETDIEKIKSWGCDHVRLPVDYNVVQNDDGSFIESGFTHIDDCITWCKKHGLKIVLDLHKCCGYVFDDAEYCSFFTDEKLQQIFKDLWMEFTRRYGKEEIVAFELLNEVTSAEFAEPWNKIAKETIAMIHAIVPEKTIIIGGIFNGSIYGLTLLEKPADDNVVFTFHTYDPLAYTHQNAYWVDRMPRGFHMNYKIPASEMAEISHKFFCNDFDAQFEGLGDQVMNADYFRKLFAPALEVSKKYGVALYCGEYGVIEEAERSTVLEWYKDIHEVLVENNIPRTAWSYKEMNFGFVDALNDDIREELISYL